MSSVTTVRKREWRKRSLLFFTLSTLIVLLAGMLTLLWQQQQRHSIKADDATIVGPPTLPAATVDQIFARLGSPMVGTGQVVEDESRKTNIDDAFALGVWWVETNDGEAGVGLGDRNPGSVRGAGGYPSAYDGYTIYPSYADAVVDWFNLLQQRYVNRGLTSVYTICYPYVGTSGALNWANKVAAMMARYQAEAPPPPTPTPTPPTKPRALLPRVAPIVTATSSQSHAPVHDAFQESRTVAVGQQAVTMPVPASEGALIGFVVALAGLLALWGLKLHGEVPVAEPVMAAGPSMAAFSVQTDDLPPLYINEFSPVAEHDTMESLPAAFTAWSFDMVDTAEVPAPGQVEVGAASGKQGKSSHLRRVVLNRGIAAQTEQLPQLSVAPAESSWMVPRETSTEALLPYRGGILLPAKMREPVSVGRAGGLLSRYGDKNEKKQG